MWDCYEVTTLRGVFSTFCPVLVCYVCFLYFLSSAGTFRCFLYFLSSAGLLCVFSLLPARCWSVTWFCSSSCAVLVRDLVLFYFLCSAGAVRARRREGPHGEPAERRPGRRPDPLRHPALGRAASHAPEPGAVRRLPIGRLQPGPAAIGPAAEGGGASGDPTWLEGVRTSSGENRRPPHANSWIRYHP